MRVAAPFSSDRRSFLAGSNQRHSYLNASHVGSDSRGARTRSSSRFLVGPTPGHALESETLPQPPSRWYLTGFLVPYEASEDQKSDPTGQEQIAQGAEGGGTDDDETPEETSARRAYFPSSVGVSVLVRDGTKTLDITITWGDYRVVNSAGNGSSGDGSERPPSGRGRDVWQRTPRREKITVPIKSGRQPSFEVPNGGGLCVVVSTRTVSSRGRDRAQRYTCGVHLPGQ